MTRYFIRKRQNEREIVNFGLGMSHRLSNAVVHGQGELECPALQGWQRLLKTVIGIKLSAI